MLQQRKLGRQGLAVSELGLGCMGMSHLYGTPDDTESVATIHRALELGINYFDTAEIYGPYINESLVGRALAGRRDQVVLATKFGFRITDNKAGGPDSRPEHIAAAVEGSLGRLGTDRVDILYQHRVDPAVPIEEVIGTMARLVEAGKARFIGLCEAGAQTIRRAHATHPISVLQSEYSLWERGLEADILPLLRELGIGLTPFSPLGRGFLTGTAQRAEDYPPGDYRRHDPRYQGANFDRNMEAARAVTAVADRKGAKPGQIALAWLLAQGNDLAPIPGTKRRPFLEENVAAAAITLGAGDLAELEAALAPGAVAGSRYEPAGLALLDR